MQERKAAVDSLQCCAALLSAAHPQLQAALAGRLDVPENHALDTFFTTVKATADVRGRLGVAAAALDESPALAPLGLQPARTARVTQCAQSLVAVGSSPQPEAMEHLAEAPCCV